MGKLKEKIKDIIAEDINYESYDNEISDYENIETLLDDLLMTSTTLNNIGALLDNQVDETELRPTPSNFSRVNTLIKYNLQELETLNVNLNDLWHKINDFINKNK